MGTTILRASRLFSSACASSIAAKALSRLTRKLPRMRVHLEQAESLEQFIAETVRVTMCARNTEEQREQ